MVDINLPIEAKSRRLRYLFLDLNSYFASVEQQENPELRGRPVAVVPVDADTSFVIAASYEAKAFGVKTGTMIGDAKRMCPGLVTIQARPHIYVKYHHAVIDAAETVLPVEEVCSIDEMRFRLLETESPPGIARELALRIKRAIREQVGESMTCSVGVAPNPFLAKLATEIQKPDGLVILQESDLPHRLYCLKLTDFTGINKRMAARLNAAGIFTAEQLCATSREGLREAFGSVIGERWWFLLRGIDVPSEATDRKSLSHSHVLAPRLRNDQGCREVMLRLIQKASARMRSLDLFAAHMTVSVSGFDSSWHADCIMPPTQDTMRMNQAFLEAWEHRTFSRPKQVSVVFTNLASAGAVTPSLFEDVADHAELNKAVDSINQRFGKNKIIFAGMHHARNSAPERIAFNKTWLFSEGKGDHDDIDTFRGQQR